MASSSRRPSMPRSSATASAPGMTWMAGWPPPSRLPSSISSATPAVALASAAQNASARIRWPSKVARPSRERSAASSARRLFSGSALPATMAPSVSSSTSRAAASVERRGARRSGCRRRRARAGRGSRHDGRRPLGACRRNPARAMRRVQLRGGARRQPARRSRSTLSLRSRAPTKQMGPYHRSSGRIPRSGAAGSCGRGTARSPASARARPRCSARPGRAGASSTACRAPASPRRA